MTVDLVAEELALRQRRCRYATATVVWVRHPTSGRPGDRALVTEDGRLRGWIGGSCAEPVVVRHALLAIAEGTPRVLHLGPPETAGRAGVVTVPVACASEGEIEVFIQPWLAPPRVVAVGSAPVLDALVAMAAAVGYVAVRVDEPGGDLRLVRHGVDRDSFVVVATFGRYDEDAVAAALATEAGYVALVASAKRSATVLEAVRAAGVDERDLARVRAPAGLDLGSLEHLEIAVAVLADIVAVRALGRTAAPVRTPGLVTDPVCGMALEPPGAAGLVTHGGVDYAFCGAGCRRRFEAEPGRYARLA